MHGTCDQGLKWVVPINLRQSDWGKGEKITKNSLGSGTSEGVMMREQDDGTLESLSSLQLHFPIWNGPRGFKGKWKQYDLGVP